nr:rhodanese-like domain-containing protein [Veillonella sp. AF42-16]
MSNFITPKELLSCLDEVIILDARGYQDYKQGHIKGAFPVDLDKDLTGPVGEHGGRHPLPDMEQLAHTFESYGITRNSKVVVYDSWLFWRAACGGLCVIWGYLMCAYCRAVLNVGLKKVIFLLKILLRCLQNQQFLIMNCKLTWL